MEVIIDKYSRKDGVIGVKVYGKLEYFIVQQTEIRRIIREPLELDLDEADRYRCHSLVDKEILREL